MSRAIRARPQSWALGLLGLLLLLSVGRGAGTMAAQFAWPQQLDESESMIVAETGLLDAGTNIYARPTPALFISAPYPPLYYLLNWPALHLVGASFKVGRAISILMTVLAGLLIAALVARVTGDWAAGAAGGLAWGALGVVYFWGALVKPDMLAVACGLAGLAWLLWRPPAQVWGALPFFWCAVYSKQTALAAAGAACLWLLLSRPRTGLLFSALFVAGALLPAALLNVATDGGYYYHLVTLHDLPWFADRYWQKWLPGFLLAYWPLVGVGTLAVLGRALAEGGRWRRGRRGPVVGRVPVPATVLLAGYLVLAVVGSAGAGTLGGNHNHFLDWAAAGCVGFGLAVAALVALAGRRGQWAGATVLVVLALQVPGLWTVPAWMGREGRGVPTGTDAEGWRNVAQYVTNDPGAVYSDNVGLLLTARKRLWTTDPYTQTHATAYGRWDERALVAALRRQAFSLVVLRTDLADPDFGQGDVSPAIRDALLAGYVLDQRNVEFIYKPR